MSSSSAPMSRQAGLARIAARATIRRHSKSFSLASLLLPTDARDNAQALYAYCRRADDAIDLVAPELQRTALTQLRAELDDVYAGATLVEPIASELQRLVFELKLPKEYLTALLDGFELDVSGAEYATLTELHYYCWCVAGSVGAMMCHVLGASRGRAIVHGAHLGMAMQLTNICRDVAEDWERGRLYLPRELLSGFEALERFPPPAATRQLLAHAVRALLREADAFYRSADAGLRYLPFRSRVAVATARRVYSGIGTRLRARDCDVAAGRVVLPTSRKLWCVARATFDAVYTGRPAAAAAGAPLHTLRFPGDVLPL